MKKKCIPGHGIVKPKQKENTTNKRSQNQKEERPKKEPGSKGMFVREAGLRAHFPAMKARRECATIAPMC